MAARDRDISHAIAWSHNGRLRDLLCRSRLDEAQEESRILHSILNDPAKKQETNDNSNVVDHYARALLALASGEVARARRGLDDLVTVVARIKRPQIYMMQNMGLISDLVWNLWQRTQDSTLLGPGGVIVKSAARIGKQYRAGKPMADLAAGDGAWLRGSRKDATRHWLASADAANARGMPYNQAQALFRLDETGCLPADHGGPVWQDLAAALGIKRPQIWSMAG